MKKLPIRSVRKSPFPRPPLRRSRPAVSPSSRSPITTTRKSDRDQLHAARPSGKGSDPGSRPQSVFPGGVGYADIPILNNREIKNIIRLKDGETQLIAGLLRDEERKTIKGIPGLKSIPGLGRLFSSEDTTIEQTDVILTITPYIIRSLPIGPEDQKPVWVDLSSVGSSLERDP